MGNPTGKTLLLVDGYSLIFRGFHALPLLSVKGTYTNAIHGFFSMLLKTITQYQPDYLCVMLDAHAPTFRHTLYADYKGTRKPMPEELRPQLPLLREMLTAMQITHMDMAGYEADDLLGTAARIANEQGVHAYILTGDRDSLQLVSTHTNVILTKSGINENWLLTPETMIEKFSYLPHQVIDMKGLMGDSSDNIPGIAGVGEKTALKLLAQYGTMDEVLSHAEEIKGKLGEKVRASIDLAKLSRELGTILCTAPIDFQADSCTFSHIKDGVPLLRKYGLNRIVQMLTNLDAPIPAPTVARQTAAKRAGGEESIVLDTAPTSEDEALFPPLMPVQNDITLTEETAIRQAMDDLLSTKPAYLVLSQDDDEVSFLTTEGVLYHLPIMRDLTGMGLFEDHIYASLAPILASVPLVVHGAKAFYTQLWRYGLPMPTVLWDTMLAAYLLHTAQKSYDFDNSLQTEYAQAPMQSGAKAVLLHAMWQRQTMRLEARKMTALYQDMELPLARVLFEMEREGFLIDKQVLKDLGQTFLTEITECKEQVYALTGVSDFNLNSPKQLGEVLFERLSLPAKKKNKSGTYSTDAEVLESLAPYHPSIEPLLRYRKLSKLQSTYVEGLQKLSGGDGRIHTTFDQTATVTGRISSLEPNLQNIPIRSEEGREIRRAFVAKEGYVLVDADYSQIELRVLAHLSGDEAMCDAFRKEQDIHTRTAAEIHGVPMDEVTPEMRRSAKATNFGIVYGISGFGLARNAGISRKDADTFIATYFERYPAVRAFMDDCVSKGHQTGFAQTMFGRRRTLYELQSKNHNVRAFGERAAMNTPVQGAAADIIKLAMVKVQNRLQSEGLQSKLILQVHDELVIEAPQNEVNHVVSLLKETMENAATLRIPLKADVHVGINWDDAH